MVNIKRIGSGILGAGAVLFVAAGAEAGLPTFDAANIAGTQQHTAVAIAEVATLSLRVSFPTHSLTHITPSPIQMEKA